MNISKNIISFIIKTKILMGLKKIIVGFTKKI